MGVDRGSDNIRPGGVEGGRPEVPVAVGRSRHRGGGGLGGWGEVVRMGVVRVGAVRVEAEKSEPLEGETGGLGAVAASLRNTG